jgi:3-hydroxybutyryl-CoA dehydrogenase
MSKIILIYNDDTKVTKEIKDSGFDSIHINDFESAATYDYAFDFTFLSISGKKNLFTKLESVQSEYFSDLTTYSNKELHAEFPKLMGSFSALLANTDKIEFFCQGNRDEVIRVLSDLNLEAIWYDYFGVGFVYARVVAQIVNEAYFALEEEVADKTDIDRAMCFGVNYPQGPFTWSKGKEKIFATLLKELASTTDNKRYKIAPLLLEINQ